MPKKTTVAVAVPAGEMETASRGVGVSGKDTAQYPEVPIPEGFEDLGEGETKEVFATVRRKGDKLCIESLDGQSLAAGGGGNEGTEGTNEPGLGQAMDDYVAGLGGGGAMG